MIAGSPTVDFIPFIRGFVLEDQKLLKAAKRFLPWVGLPLGILVLLDYLKILAALVQIGVGIWLSMLVLGLFGGLALSLAIKLNPESKWQPLRHYNLVKALPSIGWGFELCDWLLSEVSAKPSDSQAPEAAEPKASPESQRSAEDCEAWLRESQPVQDPEQWLKHSRRLDRRD